MFTILRYIENIINEQRQNKIKKPVKVLLSVEIKN